MKPLLISFSGGKTSAFMTKLIVEHYGLQDDMKIVFANTGKENEETLNFVKTCSEKWNLPIIWIESELNPEKGKGNSFKVVDYNSASRNGEPFERLIRKYGLPNRMSRFCSGKLKIEPMELFMKECGYSEFQTAIGIRADEPNRIKDKWYPLFELGITKKHVDAFWSMQDFNLALKDFQGNCDLCHMKSLSKRVKCISQNPSIADWWVEMEKLAGSTFDLKHSVKEILTSTTSQSCIDFGSDLDIRCDCID
jgi:Phosphoadenosine phosphosulfate reductase family